MAMAVGNSGKGGTMLNLNVTPLIDVLLVLLIIFMIITPTTPKGLDAIVPKPDKTKQKQDVIDRAIVVSIDTQRNIAINQQPVAIGDLGQRLVDIFKNRNQHILFIKGDPKLPFQDVAQLIDISKGAGADKIGLITKAIEAQQ